MNYWRPEDIYHFLSRRTGQPAKGMEDSGVLT